MRKEKVAKQTVNNFPRCVNYVASPHDNGDLRLAFMDDGPGVKPWRS